jgi:hypothetical protein
MAIDAGRAAGESQLGRTQRRDAWWVGPLATGLGLGLFVVYATFRAFYNADYKVERPDSAYLLSPFYSPLLVLPWLPAWISPALLILWAPGGFRLTCYYYRGAYYKSFWADPPACAVGEPRKRYRGEHSFPLILQNAHRFFMWVAIVFIAFLSYDVWLALWFTDPASGQTEFGIGVGTIVLAANVVLLACYTWGCHVLRHVVGGRLDEVSKSPVCDVAYACVSSLNLRHQLFAWCSLFSVMGADLYVRLCSMGVLTDLRIL